MIKYLLLILPVFIYAQDLRSLLESAKKNNDLIDSKNKSVKARDEFIKAKQNAYYPTIDIGSSYQSVNEKSPYQAGDVHSTYAKLSFDIYDGGKKSALIKESKDKREQSSHEADSTKETIHLQIVKDFFNIKSLEAKLIAKKDQKRLLKEQLNRMQKFFIAKLATKDDVDRLQSAYDMNEYEIESLKYEILSLKKLLELKVEEKISKLDDSKFKKFEEQNMEPLDSIKAMIAQKSAIQSSADSIQSAYNPQLKLEDTYSLNNYDRSDDFHFEGAKKQNRFLLSLNLRLFDMSSIKKTKQSKIIESQALESLINYERQKQDIEHKLSRSKIDIQLIKIKSASSALVSAKSAFKTISKKFDVGIVDHVIYLDALTSLTNAKALYQKSLNDLEMSYASYYYYSGKNIEEFLQ